MKREVCSTLSDVGADLPPIVGGLTPLRKLTGVMKPGVTLHNVDPRFVTPSIYGYKRVRNRFC